MTAGKVVHDLSEIRVGMQVASVREYRKEWQISNVQTVDPTYWSGVNWERGVVILDEPTFPDYRVPGFSIEELQKAIEAWDRQADGSSWSVVARAARNVLDAATEIGA